MQVCKYTYIIKRGGSPSGKGEGGMKMTAEVKSAAEALLKVLSAKAVEAKYGEGADPDGIDTALDNIRCADTPEEIGAALDWLTPGGLLAVEDWVKAWAELIRAEKARRRGYYEDHEE